MRWKFYTHLIIASNIAFHQVFLVKMTKGYVEEFLIKIMKLF